MNTATVISGSASFLRYQNPAECDRPAVLPEDGQVCLIRDSDDDYHLGSFDSAEKYFWISYLMVHVDAEDVVEWWPTATGTGYRISVDY